MTVKKGIIKGPSHKNGGVPFTVDGRPGFEAEGGERIISKVGTSKLDNMSKKAKSNTDYAAIGKMYVKEMKKGDKNTREQRAEDGQLLDYAVTGVNSLVGGLADANLFNASVTGLENLNAGLLQEALQDAQAKLPEFNYSNQETMDKQIAQLELGASYGLSPQTKALADRQVDEAYRSAMTQVQGGGYSAAQQIGIGSALASEYFDQKTKIAVMNETAMLEKQALLGDALADDYAREKTRFDIQYNEIAATKEAAAEYVNTAIDNHLARLQFDKMYGPGSEYDRLQQALVSYYQGITKAHEQYRYVVPDVVVDPDDDSEPTENTEK